MNPFCLHESRLMENSEQNSAHLTEKFMSLYILHVFIEGQHLLEILGPRFAQKIKKIQERKRTERQHNLRNEMPTTIEMLQKITEENENIV